MQTLSPTYSPSKFLPLYLSNVPAGFPSPADDYVETALDLQRLVIKHPAATFYVRAQGSSMAPVIENGDLLVVDKSLECHEWHKNLLHEVVPSLIAKCEKKLKVKVTGYFLQRMKTKWGGCNHRAGNIRLNTELVKKPKDLLEYVVIHEMIHLIEPTHSERFFEILSVHYPTWREARAELNELPLTAEVWK